VDPTTGLPKTHQGTGGWLAPAQRFPVQLAFESADGPPRGVRYNARASVILYSATTRSLMRSPGSGSG